jgi:hypothetical protein
MLVNKMTKLAILMARNIHKSMTHHKHVAAIIKNGKIIKIRVNHPNFHAETQVIKSEQNPDIVFVIRFENGIFKNSKPCSDCLSELRKNNVKKIAFSTGDKTKPFVIHNINEINTTWQSQLRKNMIQKYAK